MKKTISLMLCLLLIFSSINFAFAADWSTTDQNNLQSIKNAVNSGGGLYNLVNSANSNLVSACNLINTANGYLSSLVSGSGTDYTQLLTDILNSQTYFTSGGNARNSWLQKLDNDLINGNNYINTIKTNIQSLMEDYMPAMRNVQTLYLPKIHNDAHALSGTALGTAEFFSPLGSLQPWSFSYYSSDDLTARYSRAFSQTLARMYAAQHQGLGSNMGSFNLYSQYANPFSVNYVSTDDILIKSFSNLSQTLGTITSGYLNTTKIVNWKTLAETSPTSTGVASMIENYLEAIQNPIARLAYVHASDEEIAAREKAAANQTAVVNNFIDSTGSGAAPASSFGSVASMSSGYTTNMNTDASASGIWNIFNSNNFGWFSQETANQLDTTVSTRRGSSDFETPLLDQQIAEIYKELGVDVND